LGCCDDEDGRMKVEAFYAIRSALTATRRQFRIIGNVKGRKNPRSLDPLANPPD